MEWSNIWTPHNLLQQQYKDHIVSAKSTKIPCANWIDTRSRRSIVNKSSSWSHQWVFGGITFPFCSSYWEKSTNDMQIILERTSKKYCGFVKTRWEQILKIKKTERDLKNEIAPCICASVIPSVSPIFWHWYWDTIPMSFFSPSSLILDSKTYQLIGTFFLITALPIKYERWEILPIF